MEVLYPPPPVRASVGFAPGAPIRPVGSPAPLRWSGLGHSLSSYVRETPAAQGFRHFLGLSLAQPGRPCPSVVQMSHFVRIRAGSAEDPDATHAAAVIAAYFRLEEVRAFCREVWCRLALLGVVWTLMAGVLPAVRADLQAGLGLI